MSVRRTRPGEPLASYPEFGLNCLFDDGADPAEVTVFPGEEISTTEWLTADVDSAVALDDVR